MPTTRSASATETSKPVTSHQAETIETSSPVASKRDLSSDERPAKRRRGEAAVTNDNSTVEIDFGLQGDGAADTEKLARTESAALREPAPEADLVATDLPGSGQDDPELSAPFGVVGTAGEDFQQFDEIFATASAALVNSRGTPTGKGGPRIRIESLPILDNLSKQILSKLANSSYQDILAMTRELDSELGQEYSSVRSLFEHTKRLYTLRSSFLSPVELGLNEPEQVNVFRKANLATFVSTLFAGQEIGFAELNDYFLDIFVPEHGKLLKAQGSLFLDLKTQAFISSIDFPGRSNTELLYTLFPEDIERRILARRPGARSLAPSEHDFVKRASSRRDILLADLKKPEAARALQAKYHWDDFLRDVSSYLSKNSDSLNIPQKHHLALPRAFNGDHTVSPQQGLQSNFSVLPMPVAETPSIPIKQDDFAAKAARAAQIALQGHNISIPAPGLLQLHPQVTAPSQQIPQPFIHINTNFQQYTPPTQSPHHSSSRPSQPSGFGSVPALPHATQSAPTQVLYERARQATTTKSASPSAHRAGILSQRRPWTTEEENALMAGLDRVRGPHWSQILAMFGPGGTINESLKDRNQVQLKDKARNLKLFFLKSGIEVPYYLKYVTGDLKSRAPSQASKHEARERERQQGEDDKAHFGGVQGIMALGGSHPPYEQSQPPARPLIGTETARQPHVEDVSAALEDIRRYQMAQSKVALGTQLGGEPSNVNGELAISQALEGIPDLPSMHEDFADAEGLAETEMVPQTE